MKYVVCVFKIRTNDLILSITTKIMNLEIKKQTNKNINETKDIQKLERIEMPQ